MTDTLTYNPTDSEAGELTPDEQDSLQVGEKLAGEEEKLLAGKYKNAEELEKAYTELEKKLGSNDEPAEEEEVEQTTSEEDTETETSAEVALLNEANKEYWDNDGKLSEETIEKFSSMSSKDLVNAYLEATKDNPPPNQQQETDVAQQDINSIQNSVGGEKAYKDMIQWASNNLDDKAVSAFDDVVGSGNVQMIKLAVAGLKAQYDDNNGYEGRMLSGKAAQTSGDVFRSQAEVVAAMGDPRYDRDPAYRNDIYEKLDRSDLKF